MVVLTSYRNICQLYQREETKDFNYRMRTKFVQPLEGYQLTLNGPKTRFEFEKTKTSTEEDELIDVTGDDSSEMQVKVLPILEQPPSKIYYDNIEKESSDGGFFDRDDLDDEDEKNDLIIDCKLNGDTGENKTEINCRAENGQNTPLEPELVFNFTLVDTQLVYTEPSILPKFANQKGLPGGANDRPVVSITIPPPRKSSPNNQSNSILANKLKEVRIHPYQKTNLHRSYLSIRESQCSSTSVPTIKYSEVYKALPPNAPIGCRFRSSAFSPPAKSHGVPQSVPLTSSIRHPVHQRSPYAASPPNRGAKRYSTPVSPKQYPYPAYEPYSKPFRKYTKGHQTTPEAMKSPSYLPPQFGFGSSALQNLYNPDLPLDLTKNSPLSQYESMLKYPHHHQLRQGHSILRSMPVPKPLPPPKNALRPELVPFMQHPTLSKIQRSFDQVLFRQKHNPPPQASTSVCAFPSESFRQHMNHSIEEFFTHRQNELCKALRLFNDEGIDLQELFRRLDYFKLQFDRDYCRLAKIMIKRYGYRFRTGSTPTSLDYRWQETPQDFVDYFRKVKDTLRPHAPEETLNIYRMVMGALLEQFRGSLEHFLSRNLL